MKINAVALFALLSVSAFGVQAASHYSYPRQYQRAESPVRAVSPDQILRQGIDRLKGFLSREGRVTKAETREFLDQEMSNYFDFPYMARWAAGPMYKRMDDAQRVKYAAQMKAMFFSALARNLGSYSGTKPRID
ncbi:MAG: ABC transporter substrate-binding protein, partial [Gammaproteobacteria bacterium]|nr:ABC transporter substrate-binding protein [Gammaproteobacteria bacterium]